MNGGARRAATSLVLALTVAGWCAGCGTASDPSPPAGVDGLTIPTPAPGASDFVAVVDNPWLPLAVGATWTYRATDADDEEVATVDVVVEDGPDVAGVATTAVRTVVEPVEGVGDQVGPAATEESLDLYAQDDAGNVWWFGHEGEPGREWQAGTAGAEAGLAMAATPRDGDGYRLALADGVVEQRALVTGVDGTAEVQAATYAGALVVEVTDPLDAGRVQRTFYARDVGPVLSETVSGLPEVTWGLLEHVPADGR